MLSLRQIFQVEDEPWPKLTSDVDLSLTPDIWKLEQFTRQLLFVPCDLKTGGRNNELLRQASFVPLPVYPLCYTTNKFTFWKKDLGKLSFPVPLPEGYRPSNFVRWEVEPARIQGELWSIRPRAFISLDILRQNTLQFRRERVRIACPWRDVYRTVSNAHISPDYIINIPAWMYIGVQNYWDPQIGGLFASAQIDTREHYPTPWIDKYYCFEPPREPIKNR